MVENTKASGKKRRRDNNPEKSMTVTEHLRELRKRIVIIVLTLIAAVIVCYIFAPELVSYAMARAEGYKFVQTGVADLMAEYIKAALIAGVVISSPVIIWQILKFVGPGLKKNEERRFLAIVIGGVLLFIGGAAFANFVVLPFTLQFFLSLNTVGIEGMYSIKEYVGYIVGLYFAFGVIFELPVVAALLASFGILKPTWMRKGRRIVIVLCAVIGAVITPPDVVSQLMVAVPMYVLYEVSIVVCSVIDKKRRSKLLAEGIDPDEFDQEEKEKRQKSSRWAAAKATVEKRDAEKKKNK